MKRYRCIKDFVVESYDADGFLVPNEERVIEAGEVYEMEESGSTIIGGEVHLDNINDGSWLELSRENFEELFEEVQNE